MPKYSELITKLFDTNSKFVSEDFYEFVGEISKKYPNDRKKSKSTDQEGNEYVREEVAIFQDADGDKIAIMIIKLPSKTKVERARSQQRNLISAYLRNEGVFQGINSVLVAFYSDDSNDWRLSFVKQEFKLENNKIINELTPAKRYSFLVESNSKNLTVKKRLADLISERVLIADIEKAFSVEKVSKEFFEKYVGLYERLSKAFEKDEIFKKVEEENNNGDEHFRENFVKKLLGQIVFLYFLQKKGWLGVKKDEKWGDGDKNFLQNLFQECIQGGNTKKESGGKNFFNDYLEWLFYDNLNRKRENDYSEYFECRIPYLNGGLFEPINGYDWKGVANILLAGDNNNAIFRDIFVTFDEYNFTVYENDPLEQDVAVDPEMLGKVFENLLPENERKGKGAFYTPREIVHYMCKESLKNHLMNKTGISEEKINGLFERKDSMLNLKRFGEKLSDADRFSQFGEYIDFAEKIVSSLKTIKIVDPAVGSGAFPMGLLKEIVSLRKYLQENILLEENVSEYIIKKETLENCIYGVDLDPGAVEIAKLRFWLSLVIEEESKESIDPLPNLDYKIIQGNSLIEDIVVGETVIRLDIEGNSKKLTKKQTKEIGNASQIGLGFFADETEQEDTLKKLKFLHKRFFQEKDNMNKKKLKEEIDLVEKELIRISGELEVNKLKTKIESIEGKYLLSGTSPDTKDVKDIERLSSQIQGIKDMEEKYKRDNVRTFFPWKLHFAEVFNENGGFDIVIGNPPYIEFKNLHKEAKLSIEKNYTTAKGKYDIYIPFIEKSIKILKNNGVLSFINPTRFIHRDYGKELRKFILNNSCIRTIIDFCDYQVFDTALAYTGVFIYQKSINGENEIVYKKITDNLSKDNLEKSLITTSSIETVDYIKINQKILGELPWYISSDNKTGVLTKISKLGLDLINFCEGIFQGIATGKDSVFIVNELTIKSLNLEYELLVPILKGKDIYTYGLNWKNTYVIYPYNKTGEVISENDFKSKYPNIYKYLFNNRESLSGRGYFDQSNKLWYELWNQRKLDRFLVKKVITLDNASKNSFTIDNSGFIGSTTSYSLILKNELDITYEYLISILNSKVLNFYHKNNTVPQAGGFFRYQATFIKSLPIKQISLEEQKPFIDLVYQILEITKKEDFLGREDLQKQVKVLEKKIDDMVYELYELTPEEIELVEGSMKK